MMQYYVGKNGQQFGPFTEDQIRARAASGEFSPADLVWRERMANWEPLGNVFSSGDPTNPYQPSAAVMSSAVPASFNSGWTTLAGRGTRLGASILDGLVFLPAALPIFLMSAVGSNNEETGLIIAGILAIGIMILNIIWLSTRGQTIGKRITGIKIVRYEDEGNPGFVKAVLLRAVVLGVIGYVLSLVHPLLNSTLSLVDILMIFREDRRCLHDLIAGTKVVNVTTGVM